MTLSVCLIVRNEEEVIGRVLECASKFADQIVVVDSGSTDATLEIARRYTSDIHSFEWEEDFSAARNYAFSFAVSDYVMWLDADDVVTDENCERIRGLVAEGGFDMAYLLYAAAFDGDNPTFIYYRERIFRRSGNYKFSGAVHEAVAPRGKRVFSSACVEHRKIKPAEPMRNLRIYQKQIKDGKKLDARSLFYYGRELMYNNMYIEAIAVLRRFIEGDGWSENKIEACINLCRILLALGRDKEAVESLLYSFTFSPPRAEACCILGERFLNSGDYNSAIYWYTRALDGNDKPESGGFVNIDFCEFIPCMQLCMLYDKLGKTELALSYNERAGKAKPRNENYLKNKQYFKEKLSQR